MTSALRNPGRQTAFSDWLRALPGTLSSARFSNQNLDYVWHNYRENWLILIEEKTHCADQDRAQRDTHNILDQLLRIASGSAVDTMRGRRVADYRGYYLLQFENTHPDDSDWMAINGQRAERADLLELLATGGWHEEMVS